MRNFGNFYVVTAADWKPIEMPDREPDYVSKSGSKYWDMKTGVIRQADHWGVGIGDCNWFLTSISDACVTSPTAIKFEACGYCAYEDFRQNSLSEKMPTPCQKRLQQHRQFLAQQRHEKELEFEKTGRGVGFISFRNRNRKSISNAVIKKVSDRMLEINGKRVRKNSISIIIF